MQLQYGSVDLRATGIPRRRSVPFGLPAYCQPQIQLDGSTGNWRKHHTISSHIALQELVFPKRLVTFRAAQRGDDLGDGHLDKRKKNQDLPEKKPRGIDGRIRQKSFLERRLCTFRKFTVCLFFGLHIFWGS